MGRAPPPVSRGRGSISAPTTTRKAAFSRAIMRFRSVCSCTAAASRSAICAAKGFCSGTLRLFTQCASRACRACATARALRRRDVGFRSGRGGGAGRGLGGLSRFIAADAGLGCRQAARAIKAERPRSRASGSESAAEQKSSARARSGCWRCEAARGGTAACCCCAGVHRGLLCACCCCMNGRGLFGSRTSTELVAAFEPPRLRGLSGFFTPVDGCGCVRAPGVIISERPRRLTSAMA